MMRTRALIASGAIGLALAAVTIGGFIWFQPSPEAAPAATPTATAEITRGMLRDTKSVTGTLNYGDLSTLRPSLTDAPAMVTSIAPTGTIVERGGPLYALDGQPTILFYGSVAQHRTLRFDLDEASPVWVELEQIQRAVEAAELTLGLEQERLTDAQTRITETSTRLEDASAPTPATAEFIELAGAIGAAVDKLGRVKALSAAELTPSVEIVAAEGGVAAARNAFDAAVRALRGDLAGARLDAITARIGIAEAQGKLDELRTSLNGLATRFADDADIGQIADNLAALGYEGALADQVRAWQRDAGLPVTGIVRPSQLVIADGPVHIAARNASVGETVGGSSQEDSAILEYSGVEKIATVPLSVSDQGLAAVGRAVTITLPDNSEVDGTISEVGSIVTNGTIEVTIAIADQEVLSEITVAAIEVGFVSDSRENVLSVPIVALIARPEGGFAVNVLTPANSALVSVDTGLFAAGRVEISGEGLAEGMRVGVSG